MPTPTDYAVTRPEGRYVLMDDLSWTGPDDDTAARATRTITRESLANRATPADACSTRGAAVNEFVRLFGGDGFKPAEGEPRPEPGLVY